MRWWVHLIIVLLLLPLAYYAVFPQILRCQFIAYSSDFQSIHPSVFVSNDTPPRQRALLLQEMRQASARIKQLWQSTPQGRAKVIFCLTPEQYEEYCTNGEGAGCSLGTPWGSSWIIVNPYGRNPDVLAHEMCHDELFTRLGWLTVQRQIPQWFNEGLALMVDQRFSETTDSLQRYEDFRDEWQYLTYGQQYVLELNTIESLSGFFSGGETRVQLAYITAGMEVSRWLAQVGRSGVPKLVRAVEEGEAFWEAYRRLEKQATTKRRP